MTNRTIYDAALRLCGELEDSLQNADYKARAEQLLAIFCRQNARLDQAYREGYGLEQQQLPTELTLSLSAAFPLCDEFSAPAAAALASLLLLGENTAVSQRLQAQADADLERIRRSIPFQKGSILSAYS